MVDRYGPKGPTGTTTIRIRIIRIILKNGATWGISMPKLSSSKELLWYRSCFHYEFVQAVVNTRYFVSTIKIVTWALKWIREVISTQRPCTLEIKAEKLKKWSKGFQVFRNINSIPLNDPLFFGDFFSSFKYWPAITVWVSHDCRPYWYYY